MTATVNDISTGTIETTPLATRLKEGTRQIHSDAENMRYISELMGGKLSVAAYRDLAIQQHYIYAALEQATEDIAGTPQADTLTFAELTRSPSIAQDLEFLVGPDWAERIQPLPATLVYVERLRQASGSLARYAAHAWTRYLGDLSGGQVIKVMMQRHYGMGQNGLNFYDFKEIVKAKPFKDLYRERLNGLQFTETEVEEAVAEALVAFELNQKMFAELGAIHCN